MVEVYAGLDVSDKLTHVCVVDAGGDVIWSGACATDPETIAKTLKARAPGLLRAVLETGALSAFLYHGLVERGVAVVCVCARHAKGALSARVNKSDPHDAEGLAQMARTGWFKQVRIKAEATHMDRARLKIHDQLIDARQAIAGQLRGLLKLFGLRLGKVTTPNKRRERLTALFAQQPELEHRNGDSCNNPQTTEAWADLSRSGTPRHARRRWRQSRSQTPGEGRGRRRFRLDRIDAWARSARNRRERGRAWRAGRSRRRFAHPRPVRVVRGQTKAASPAHRHSQ